MGNSAEWIVEAPTVGGAQSAMADYGEVFFSVCEAFAASRRRLFQGTTVNGGTGDNINMNDSAGHEVSAGQPDHPHRDPVRVRGHAALTWAA